MKKESNRYIKIIPVLLGLVAGIFLMMFFVSNRQSPSREDGKSPVVDVTVIEARALPFRVEARGHGVSRPSETWQAVVNVPGRVVERHPDLESGAMHSEGTLLVALDPSRYELAISDVRAELNSLDVELDKLDMEEANTQRLLELEKERLELVEAELDRMEQLFRSESVSRTELDNQLRATLAQRQAVTSLENTLALLPTRRDLLTAQKERASVRLAQAQRDLEDTKFVAPYDLRLDQVEVELHQYVNPGQRLFQADSVVAAEVEAQIPISMMRRLMGNFTIQNEDALDLSKRINLPTVDAELELVGAEGVGWQGHVTRVASGLEPTTRAVRVVIQVDWPYRDVRPPNRPPLQRDMYIRVRLSTMSAEPLMVVPLSAVHQGEIWIVDEEQRLERRPVVVDFEQNDLAVISSGLEAGEHVIVDDLSTAIQGMALSPLRDEKLEARIASLAEGNEP